ncbi:BrxA family protein [Succinivibrio faecicola]|uniref:DUF1819 family protein n=1 Tax=Succinivibrio faecicola TaxID=2820300 RepID=A0ABS7DI41_9GAMM|nr:BrxA family protein [Succinivibrio faecicola]MBW7570964.1 DUF1819 family protein [Succinivibrio faecicola]
MILPNEKFKFSMIDNLMFHLSSEMISLYDEEKDWLSVRKIAIEKNLAQKNAVSSRERYVNEVLSRVRYLSEAEIYYFLNQANDNEQHLLLWIALCRANRLAREFAVKLLRESFLNFKTEVSFDDFDAFYFDLSSSNSELDNVSTQMRNKIRGRIINSAKEAGLLTKDNFIQPVFLSADFCKCVSDNSLNDLSFLPIYDADIKRLLQS